ncbi:MAG TPA: 2-phospho-L-lactate transferase [Candidatus Baltobacteraceae bacterium]|nr:2-phospho-L-lactate transferase [Candidatus Baltobacteraceae bacterium]
MPVVVLAGGVGGAKLAHGLQQVLPPGDLTVIVNVGDDLELHGLAVMPDHDTVVYTLAGLADPVQGWGLAGETYAAAGMLARYGQPTWFRLGDQDLATHVVRTVRLRAGERLTTVCLTLQAALGLAGPVLPMSDDPVRTRVRTDEGWLDFQDYFVRLHQAPEVREVRFDGATAATAAPEVITALGAAEVIVIAPSNPIVSIEPILAVPGIRAAMQAARQRGVPVVAVSPIVGGRALKGPADRMLRSLGSEASALGVATRYVGLVDGFVIDETDHALGPSVAALGLRVLVTDTIMADDAARARVARATLRFAASQRTA